MQRTRVWLLRAGALVQDCAPAVKPQPRQQPGLQDFAVARPGALLMFRLLLLGPVSDLHVWRSLAVWTERWRQGEQRGADEAELGQVARRRQVAQLLLSSADEDLLRTPIPKGKSARHC